MIKTIMMATITPPMMFAIFDFDIVDPLSGYKRLLRVLFVRLFALELFNSNPISRYAATSLVLLGTELPEGPFIRSA